jgi:hypothetical protein
MKKTPGWKEDVWGVRKSNVSKKPTVSYMYSAMGTDYTVYLPNMTIVLNDVTEGQEIPKSKGYQVIYFLIDILAKKSGAKLVHDESEDIISNVDENLEHYNKNKKAYENYISKDIIILKTHKREYDIFTTDLYEMEGEPEGKKLTFEQFKKEII